MPLQPVADYLFVQPIVQESKTEGGIVLPDSARPDPNLGEVIASSEKARLAGYVPGTVVLFSEFAGQSIQRGQDSFLVLSLEDILGIEEQPDC